MRDVVNQPELVFGAQRRPSELPRTVSSLQRVRALQKGGHRHSLGKKTKQNTLSIIGMASDLAK